MADKKFFKIFSSRESECNWLNSLGYQGYLLIKLRDNSYEFVFSADHKYYYSLEYIEGAPNSDTSVSHIESYKESGIEFLFSKGHWMYFARADEPIVTDADVYKRNSEPYFRKMLYEFFFAFIGAVFTGYQVFMINFLKNSGDIFSGSAVKLLSIKTDDAKILQFLKEKVNSLAGVTNKYFDLWFKLFGHHKPVAVMAIIVPITAVLIVLGALNLDKFIGMRKLKKITGGKRCRVKNTA